MVMTREPPAGGMTLEWATLDGMRASPEGSAYAEFWLGAPDSASDPQLALAGVVAHIGPVLQDLLRASLREGGAPTGNDPGANDPPAAAK